jgi:hypothetical protein
LFYQQVLPAVFDVYPVEEVQNGEDWGQNRWKRLERAEEM